MPDQDPPAFLRTFIAIVVGCVGFTALGGGIGRAIALVDPTAEAVVPVVICAALGFVIGGAFGCSVSLQARKRAHAGLASTVVFIVLLVTLIASAAVAASAGVPFLALLAAGPLLSAFLAVELSAPRTATRSEETA